MSPRPALPIADLLQDGTLFLDRDGVLNRRLPDDYVKHWGEWAWLPGVLPALAQLAARVRAAWSKSTCPLETDNSIRAKWPASVPTTFTLTEPLRSSLLARGG